MRVWAWIKNDWPRKLAALLFAVVIWYSVYLQLREEAIIPNVSVTVLPPPGLSVLNPDRIPKVTVKIRGSNREISRLRGAEDVTIHYDVPVGQNPGTYDVALSEKDVTIRHRAQLVSLQPRTFSITLDRYIEETKPLSVVVVGKPPDGWAIRRRETEPQRVTVTGPAKRVQAVASVQTEDVPLGPDTPPDFTIPELKLRPVQHLTLSPEVVSLRIELMRTRGTVAFRDLPIQELNKPGSDFYVAEFLDPGSDTVEVTIEGPKEVTDESLSPASVRPFIDLSDIAGTGVHQLNVRFYIHARDCVVTWSRPIGVKVRVARRPPRPPESTVPEPRPGAP